MNNKILVTGGTGYIGSHTVVELINEGFDVVIIDNLSNSNLEVLDGIESITGVRPQFEKFDLQDKAKVDDFFQQNPAINAIIHFAALKAVGESVDKPLAYYRNNLTLIMNLMDAMVRHNISNLVFSSSCTVYGEPEDLPVSEESPVQKPSSPYGNTKKISEEIMSDAIAAYQALKGISLRYFNPIGAHPSALIGELPIGVPENLVPFITQTAIGLRDELKVFGNDYNTPDGSAIRDYIYVVDLARAHLVALNRLLQKKNKSQFEVFNLGTGNGVSVLEMVKTFEKVTNKKLYYRIVDRRPGDVEKVWADTSYANKELGWKAETSLEDTLASAWKWEQYYRQKKQG